MEPSLGCLKEGGSASLGCRGGRGERLAAGAVPGPTGRNSVSQAWAVCASQLQSVESWLLTALQPASPRSACVTSRPPWAAAFPEDTAVPREATHCPITALTVGARRRNQNCMESEQLRTQFGLVRRMAGHKGTL